MDLCVSSVFHPRLSESSSTSPRSVHTLPAVKQTIVTLDLEGVLVPEIWIAVAEKTGIADLRRTTRDEQIGRAHV